MTVETKTAAWTPERIQRLAELWEEGLPTRVIGEHMGITKNAVVGKVHRLGLAKRASPIAPKQPPAEVVRLEGLGFDMCCWPFGEPGTPDFRFCGRQALADKPYCAEHCKRAYVHGPKEQREKAVA